MLVKFASVILVANGIVLYDKEAPYLLSLGELVHALKEGNILAPVIDPYRFSIVLGCSVKLIAVSFCSNRARCKSVDVFLIRINM